MSEKRVPSYIISRCADCNMFYGDVMEGYYVCLRLFDKEADENKQIYDRDKIPSWCPLPDTKDNTNEEPA